MSGISVLVVPSPFFSLAGKVVITLPPTPEGVSNVREYSMTRAETEALIEDLSSALYSKYLNGKTLPTE